MKLNKLGLLSLLALIGILGFTTENKAYLGFFGFLGYVRYFFVTPDELFIQNIRKAASLGFFSGVIAMGIGILLHVLLSSLIKNTAVLALAASYVVSMLSFSIALVVLELREQKED